MCLGALHEVGNVRQVETRQVVEAQRVGQAPDRAPDVEEDADDVVALRLHGDQGAFRRAVVVGADDEGRGPEDALVQLAAGEGAAARDEGLPRVPVVELVGAHRRAHSEDVWGWRRWWTRRRPWWRRGRPRRRHGRGRWWRRWRRLGPRVGPGGFGDDDHAALDTPTLRQAARGAREWVAPRAAERDLELRAPASTKELATAPRDCKTAGAAAAVRDRQHRRPDLQLATRDLAGALGHGDGHSDGCRRGLCLFGQRNESQDDAQPDGYARYAPPHTPLVGSPAVSLQRFDQTREGRRRGHKAARRPRLRVSSPAPADPQGRARPLSRVAVRRRTCGRDL